MVLETKIRKLKEAISCINDDKEAELEELIHKWRAGGREIVERFFVVVPRQEESSEANNPQSSFNYPWSEDAPRGPMLTEEQREYLARAPTNDDGDPVDHEGNPLLPEMMTREEVMRGINAETEAGERREGQGEYRPTSMTR